MGNTENNYDVLGSALRLARALRRNAPKHDHMLPPAVERTLVALNENNGLSSGELCEALGVRPSSLSELIDRMEKHGLAERCIDEQDKRIVRISLTEHGAEIAAKIAEKISSRKAEAESCFDEGEAELFCRLADKLSAHLQGGEDDLPPFGGHGPRGHGHGHRRGPHGFGPGMPAGPGFGGPMAYAPGFGHGCKGPGFGHPMAHPYGFGHGCKGPGFGHPMAHPYGFGPGMHGHFKHHRHHGCRHISRHLSSPYFCRHGYRHPGQWDCRAEGRF